MDLKNILTAIALGTSLCASPVTKAEVYTQKQVDEILAGKKQNKKSSDYVLVDSNNNGTPGELGYKKDEKTKSKKLVFIDSKTTKPVQEGEKPKKDELGDLINNIEKNQVKEDELGNLIKNIEKNKDSQNKPIGQQNPDELDQFLKQQNIVNNTKTEVKNTLENNLTSFEITESKRFAGKVEVDYFIKYFNITNSLQFKEKVLEIQSIKGYKGSKDGIIGPATLKVIYKNYYINSSNHPTEITSRIKLIKNLETFPKKAVFSSGQNAYNKNYFYGEGVGENISGTYFNEQLYRELEKIDKNFRQNNKLENSIIVEKLPSGKYYLKMYVNGKLEVLTYVSPGTRDHRTFSNVIYNFNKYFSSHYFSNKYDNAAMPFAYNINGGVFGHVGSVDGNLRSHGCVRTPGFYQTRIWDLLQENKDKKFKIKIGNLY